MESKALSLKQTQPHGAEPKRVLPFTPNLRRYFYSRSRGTKCQPRKVYSRVGNQLRREGRLDSYTFSPERIKSIPSASAVGPFKVAFSLASVQQGWQPTSMHANTTKKRDSNERRKPATREAVFFTAPRRAKRRTSRTKATRLPYTSEKTPGCETVSGGGSGAVAVGPGHRVMGGWPEPPTHPTQGSVGSGGMLTTPRPTLTLGGWPRRWSS